MSPQGSVVTAIAFAALAAGSLAPAAVAPSVGATPVSTPPTVRAADAHHPISPERVLSGKPVKEGKSAAIPISQVNALPADGVTKVVASVTLKSPVKGAATLKPNASSSTATIRFKAKKAKTASVTLSPGNPVGWSVRNQSSGPLRISVTVTGYWSTGVADSDPPAELPGDPPSEPTPDPSPPDSSPGPVSGSGRYDIGSPTPTDIWVDPASGSDARSGDTRGNALRTITAAWNRIPANQTLTTGYRIQLVAGTYPADAMPNYWENRRGTYANPIIIRAADGQYTARLLGDINMFNVSYFYLMGAEISRNGDAFHCEQCTYTLIRDSRLEGDETRGGAMAHETIKVNQSDHFYIEDSEIAGAEDNSIDFVAVQYGHLRGNRVSRAGDWCAYTKGGSAYLTVSENEFFDCGTGGYTAGQGTGIEFITQPWIHYEAMDIRVVNNIIHDTEGAGLGVNGGYNILLAYNTMYRVGQRSHVIEFVFGLHSCDGAPGNTAGCAVRTNAGGWGTLGTSETFIPNKHVYFFNNVLLNPTGYESQWQHFEIPGPRSQPSGAFNVPNPATSDSDLRVEGNVIWNGNSSKPLGIDSGTGCAPSNATCNASQLVSDNRINVTQPDFVNAAALDFRPAPGGWLAGRAAVAIPDFAWSDKPGASIPSGSTSNVVPLDRAGDPRTGWGRPGAY